MLLERVKEAAAGSTTRQAPERSRSFCRTLVIAGPSAPAMGEMATSTLRVCSITMTGAESWDRRREGASRSSGRINLIETDKSMGAKAPVKILA
jgi:hypothetical protein